MRPTRWSTALLNVPDRVNANGAVYWQVYRAGVTNVILLEPHTGRALAQWNICRPGRRYPDAPWLLKSPHPPTAATDLTELADVAALTFPLACPPTAARRRYRARSSTPTSPPQRFREYLSRSRPRVLAARTDGRSWATRC